MNRKDKVDKLFEENMNLVYFVVNKKIDKHNKRYKELGVDEEDLRQLGFIGLLKACKKFNESKGIKFSTYAVPLIYGEITNNLRDDTNITIPREAMSIALKIKQKVEKQDYEIPEIEEIMEEYEVSNYIAEAVIFSLKLKYVSAEKVVYNEGSAGNTQITLKEMLTDNFNLQNTVEANVIVKEKLSILDERERKIVLLTSEGLKQREIANIIGIKQPHVCRIYKDAIKKMQEGELINV